MVIAGIGTEFVEFFRTDGLLRTDKGTATGDALGTVTAFPDIAIIRCAFVIVMPAIMHPLRNITRGVIDAKLIGFKTADFCGFAWVQLTVTGETMCLARLFVKTPPEWCIFPARSGIFPFCFTGQSVFLAGLIRQPAGIVVGIIPTDKNYW